MKKIVAIVGVALLMSFGSANAETCYKSGEEKSGIGKVCTYRCLSGKESLNVGVASVCPVSIDAGGSGAGRGPRLDETRMGGSLGPSSCYKRGEETTGTTKQCEYSCSGAKRLMTVGASQTCPLQPG